MKNLAGDTLVHKQWDIYTADKSFYEVFRNKICANSSRDGSVPGDYPHPIIEGRETARSSY